MLRFGIAGHLHDTARNLFDKSRGEKRLGRFSFIRAEAFIPHPFGCHKRYESRLQFLMRTQSAAFTARFVIGGARKSCALLGIYMISREAKNDRVVFLLSAHKFLRTARNLCALNFHTASGGHGIRGSLFLFALR